MANEDGEGGAWRHLPFGHLPLGHFSSLPFILAIRIYQVTLGPLMGGHCRFVPTCSHYALEAYRQHGPLRGTWLTARRLLRCHPFCRGGYDPVPLQRPRSSITRLRSGTPASGPRL